MPDMLAQALAVPGLGWLFFAVALAGLVRGFSGFGTAMVFLPVAAGVLGPVGAITSMLVMDFFGPLPFVRRCLRDAYLPDLARIGVGMIAALPIGVWVLTSTPEDALRYAISLVSLALLVALIAGLRYRGQFNPPLLFATGAGSGLLGGAVGLGGPPVIMLYMASTRPAQEIRANTLLFLLLTDIAMLAVFALNGVLQAGHMIVGLLILPVYMSAMALGAWIFRPGAERTYRGVAYAIIALSALSGLPLLD